MCLNSVLGYVSPIELTCCLGRALNIFFSLTPAFKSVSPIIKQAFLEIDNLDGMRNYHGSACKGLFSLTSF